MCSYPTGFYFILQDCQLTSQRNRKDPEEEKEEKEKEEEEERCTEVIHFLLSPVLSIPTCLSHIVENFFVSFFLHSFLFVDIRVEKLQRRRQKKGASRTNSTGKLCVAFAWPASPCFRILMSLFPYSPSWKQRGRKGKEEATCKKRFPLQEHHEWRVAEK